MARHRKTDLLDIVVQAVRDCNWNVLYIGDVREHPFLLRIYSASSEKSYLVRVYIWHLTHGGGAKRPVDEYRVQITGIKKFERVSNEKTLVLGWWDAGEVFAGFDVSKHSRELGFSPSIQIREEALRKAHIRGIAAISKGNKEIAVAFRPDLFVHYVEGLEEIHGFGESDKDFQILERVIENSEKINDGLIEKVSAPRKMVAATINKKLRDASFQSRVLTAYSFTCAFCGIQLKLIDAAHIVPVSEPSSSDETCNGISLCPLHHRAFDRALVTLNEKYQIILNEKELTKLKKIGHDGEMDRFVKTLKPIIKTPPSLNDMPHKDYIKQANHIRGWF